jgi:hypothetical protein
LTSCKVEDKKTTYTYTAGSLIGGLIEESKFTGNGSTVQMTGNGSLIQMAGNGSMIQMAHNVADSVLKYLTKE